MPTPSSPCNPHGTVDQALRIVAEHLSHAQRSHELALRLQAQGQTEAARQQVADCQPGQDNVQRGVERKGAVAQDRIGLHAVGHGGEPPGNIDRQDQRDESPRPARRARVRGRV